MSVDLRSFIYLDSLQPQVSAIIATISRGFLPTVGEAALIVEIAPGIAINQLTDIAVKRVDVRPGMQIVERRYGMLEIHSESQGDVREAGRAILENLDLEENDRLKPKVLSSQVIRNVDDLQVQLINRGQGMMLVGGDRSSSWRLSPQGMRPSRRTKPRKRRH